jgi:hypothetical protein
VAVDGALTPNRIEAVKNAAPRTFGRCLFSTTPLPARLRRLVGLASTDLDAPTNGIHEVDHNRWSAPPTSPSASAAHRRFPRPLNLSQPLRASWRSLPRLCPISAPQRSPRTKGKCRCLTTAISLRSPRPASRASVSSSRGGRSSTINMRVVIGPDMMYQRPDRCRSNSMIRQTS